MSKSYTERDIALVRILSLTHNTPRFRVVDWDCLFMKNGILVEVEGEPLVVKLWFDNHEKEVHTPFLPGPEGLRPTVRKLIGGVICGGGKTHRVRLSPRFGFFGREILKAEAKPKPGPTFLTLPVLKVELKHVEEAAQTARFLGKKAKDWRPGLSRAIAMYIPGRNGKVSREEVADWMADIGLDNPSMAEHCAMPPVDFPLAAIGLDVAPGNTQGNMEWPDDHWFVGIISRRFTS